MVRVVQPLFADTARGRIGTIGTFRMSHSGPQFIEQAKGSGGNTEAQAKLRRCFAEAKAAHALIPPIPWESGGRHGIARTPRWPAFWRQWLLDHPECQE